MRKFPGSLVGPFLCSNLTTLCDQERGGDPRTFTLLYRLNSYYSFFVHLDTGCLVIHFFVHLDTECPNILISMSTFIQGVLIFIALSILILGVLIYFFLCPPKYRVS